jgi:hypothetical protein
MLEFNETYIVKNLALSAPKQIALISIENEIKPPGWKKSML